MDQVKTGAFIAALRREKGWTQEELGERLGISNKTVSRWENGNYMPSIEMLSLLSREFGVSLNELVEGQRLDDGEDFRAAADKNLASAMEGRLHRFWRWVERYSGFLVVIMILCVLIACVIWSFVHYQREHPLDAQPLGTFWNNPENPFDILYFTFSYDGRYYIFTPAGEYLEVGDYSRDRDVVTLDNGKTVRWIVVKGRTIRDIDPRGGGLLTYQQVRGYPPYGFLIGEAIPSHNIAP